MSLLLESGRNKLWFGTLDRMEWMPTPNRGTDVSSQGWSAGGSLLSGGAYQLNSYSSAKNFIFEWPNSSSREAAQRMKSYADGSYGRGLIYFIDPLTYNTNLFPALWADPSMAISSEAPTLVPGVSPSAVPSSGPVEWGLPVVSAFYDLSSIGTTDPATLDDSNSVFIPIPDGYRLAVGAFYSYTGTARVHYSRIARGGSSSGSEVIASSDSSLLTTSVDLAPGEIGIRVWVGKTASGPATITVTSMMACLFPLDRPHAKEPTQWIGGQGHSGCRFGGTPTYINNTGVNGGQVSYAASFREVGSWVNG